MQQYFEAPKTTLIYVFRINDAAHEGCLKVGETTLSDDSVNVLQLQPNASVLNRAARHRIDQYTQTAGISYDLLYTEPTLHLRGNALGWFNDKEVHQVLLRSGIRRKQFKGTTAQGTEWFETDLATVRRAIAAVKAGRRSLLAAEVTQEQSPIVFRPEQREAIDKTVRQFKKGTQMLWNAKMRFGKTLSALQVVKQLQYARTLILTHRPVVDSGWFDDFRKIFYDAPQYVYGSKNNGEPFASLERLYDKEGKHYVYFASMQDLRGSELVGGKFLKNDALFSTPWQLIIVDEAHEGTQTELGRAVMTELTKKQTRVLRLSGTPFNLLDDFRDDEIYTWDYVMEQRAKAEWDATHCGDPNPYAALPRLNIYTYDLGRLLSDFRDEDVAFNFREFFRTDTDGRFVHERDVQAFLNLLTRDDPESLYPFANDRYRTIFRHTLWMLPGVRAAKAMSQLLQAHPVFQHFRVVNVAGDGDDDEERGDALRLVEEAIGPDPDQTRTITLSCGRLTTGVSVKAWTGVLMLAGSYHTAASAYMQTIFRVQTPAIINGRMKEDCYVFDFAPDRTLQVLATVPRVNTKAGRTTSGQKQALGDFLNFCPVIAIQGSRMEEMNVTRMLQQLKRAYVERVVRNGFEDACLYNDELLRLTDVELRDFTELKKIIGQTKAMAATGNIDVNAQGLTNEEYEERERLEKKKKKELTPEEKARLEELKKRRKLKDDAISILRGISIRMPLLIYGADIRDEETELTIDNFTQLVDPQSWEEFMPRGVTKQRFNAFKRYYDPEIFSAAGRRIRSMARAADRLTVEERISRIAAIFQTFRNPDKETVLTPWRVVNMHLGDTLGGYCFFDKDYKEPLDEPRYIDHGRVTTDVFHPGSHVLEINSKSGLYPLYVAYNIYRARLSEGMFTPQTLEEHQAVWDKVVAENIFVICKTPMAKLITRRTLLGFRPGRTRMWAPEDLINKIKNQPELFIKKVHGLVGTNMKINAVVGNPPYQLVGGSGGTNDAPIYQDFCNIVFDIKPQYSSLIIPARWFSGGRETLLGDFRKRMLTSKQLSKLVAYTNAQDVFNNVEIKGGISYYLADQQKHDTCDYTLIKKDERQETQIALDTFDIFIREPIVRLIVEKTEKIRKQSGVLAVDSIISSDTPFGIPTNPKSSKKTPFKVFSTKSDAHDTLLLYLDGGKRLWEYVAKSQIKKNAQDIDKHKVFIPKAGGTGSDSLVLGKPECAPNNSVCSQTFLYAPFDTEEEARNFVKYLRTKFLRVLLSSIKITQDVLSGVYRFVPLQDFTSSSDIDWCASVSSIDSQLYAKYGLSAAEVAFIERMIKPM